MASLFGLASGCGLNPAFGITDGGTTTEIMTTHSSLSEPTGVPTTGPASNETTETITTGSTTNETPETSTRETLDTTSTTDGEMCGNGLLEVEEQCDDGNRMFQDGCTPNCELEIGVIDACYDHTCALLEGGDVRCWGSGAYGQLGYGNTEMIGDGELPSDVDPVDLDIPAIQISIGYYYTCALLEGGDVRCWGCLSTHSALPQLTNWPVSPLSLEHFVLYDDTDGELSTLARQLVGQSLAPKDAAATFAQVCGDFWYYQLRTFTRLQRGQEWAARHDFNFVIMGNLLALLRLECGATTRWRGSAVATGIEEVISPERRQQLDGFIPAPGAVALLDTMRHTAYLGETICRAICQKQGWPWREELARQVHQVLNGAWT